jgi:beta-glucosidase
VVRLRGGGHCVLAGSQWVGELAGSGCHRGTHLPPTHGRYYPGQLGGTAIVNTLLGKNNPGGKTPITWCAAPVLSPRLRVVTGPLRAHAAPWCPVSRGATVDRRYPESITQRSIYDMELDSGEGLTHLYYKGEVIWPFGWGLSYTTFTYTWHDGVAAAMEATVAGLLSGATVSRTCTVKNTGQRTGDAVVLGFLTNATDPDFPRQKLFDFARVSLAPGASTSVTLVATAEHLSSVDRAGRRWLRPSTFVVRVGDVVTPATATLQLTGEPVILEDLSRFL